MTCLCRVRFSLAGWEKVFAAALLGWLLMAPGVRAGVIVSSASSSRAYIGGNTSVFGGNSATLPPSTQSANGATSSYSAVTGQLSVASDPTGSVNGITYQANIQASYSNDSSGGVASPSAGVDSNLNFQVTDAPVTVTLSLTPTDKLTGSSLSGASLAQVSSGIYLYGGNGQSSITVAVSESQSLSMGEGVSTPVYSGSSFSTDVTTYTPGTGTQDSPGTGTSVSATLSPGNYTLQGWATSSASFYGAYVYDPATGYSFVPSTGTYGDANVTSTATVSFSAAATTPEPASLTLLGLGGLSLAGYGWRLRKLSAVA